MTSLNALIKEYVLHTATGTEIKIRKVGVAGEESSEKFGRWMVYSGTAALHSNGEFVRLAKADLRSIEYYFETAEEAMNVLQENLKENA